MGTFTMTDVNVLKPATLQVINACNALDRVVGLQRA